MFYLSRQEEQEQRDKEKFNSYTPGSNAYYHAQRRQEQQAHEKEHGVIERGDRVEWVTEHGTIQSGLVAETMISNLTGLRRARIVDFWSERKDNDAGQWKYVDDLRKVVE